MKTITRRTQVIGGLLAAGCILSLTACAGLKGFRSSREVTLTRLPYYQSFSRTDLQNARVGHLPIMLDKRAGDPTGQDVCQALLNEMNSFLDSKEWTTGLERIDLTIDHAPDLFVGCPDMFGAPVRSLSSDEDDEELPSMVLYYQNASAEWKAALVEAMRKKHVEYALLTMLGYSDYTVRQKNILGKKELPLGTGYRVPVKWLTSLDDPVEVLHLTGAVLDTTGKVHRVGAEGVIAAKTASLIESALNLQNVISAEVIRSVATEVRRDDLPGKPLSYQVAIQNLVAQLLQQKDLIIE